MKKFIYSCLFLAMAAITFSSCEDVPAPYNMPTEDETPEVQPAGTGTAADPFNVAGVEKYIDEGGSAETEVYVKGKVVSVVQGSWDAKYGSLKYYISEDGTATNQFYVYNGYAGPNRTKFSGEDALKQGDEVVICGKVDSYNGTKEFLVGNYIVSLNGVGGTTTPDTPTTGKGSESNPYTVAEAIAAIKAGAPTSEVYVTGIVSDVYFYSDQYKSLSYYISDDGKSKDMQVYSGKGLNGADFTSKDDLKVGQKVTIKGIIKAFNKNGTDIMEIDKNSTIVKIEGEGTGGEVTPKPDTPDTPSSGEGVSIDGTTVTLTNSKATAGESVTLNFADQGFENAQEIKTVTLPDGTTVTFDANGNKNTPKFYTATKGVRVYANSILKFEGIKDIAKIVMQCDSYNGTKYVGNETATITFSGKTATYTNIFTGTTGGGVQLRVLTIEMFYAR
uniref:hypothetical protein n=1 Tax=Prevotella sp. TaxID=59823 RepID=UPI00402704C6